MITIDEIKNVSFRKAGRQGYMAEDVDAFIDEVIVAFEQLKKEKTNLVHKIDVLATRVEQYRADEETVRNALLASQKTAGFGPPDAAALAAGYGGHRASAGREPQQDQPSGVHGAGHAGGF